MTPVQRKRVKRFIKFIKKIPPESFKLDITCSLNGSSWDRDLETFIKKIKGYEPGAKACCAGLLPLYNSREFKWSYQNSLLGIVDSKGCNNPWYILEDYFGLSKMQLATFDYYSYNVSVDKITPIMVAERLETLIK